MVEFASGNMYGPVPALATLADLGIKKVQYYVVDKDYGDWLKKAEEHPLPLSPLPHAINWDTVWAEWAKRVQTSPPPRTVSSFLT